MRFGTLDFDRKRRSWIALFAAALLLASLGSALAQTMERLPKVGYLGFGAAFQLRTFFQNRLSELGYTEGQEVVVEYRFADGRPANSRAWPASWSTPKWMSSWPLGTRRS
jgi:putative tryptophan/tyrosine transport system substrate-binding protein